MGLEQLQNGCFTGCKTGCKTVVLLVAKRLQNGCNTVAVIARLRRPNAATPDTLYSQSTTVKKNSRVARITFFVPTLDLAFQRDDDARISEDTTYTRLVPAAAVTAPIANAAT